MCLHQTQKRTTFIRIFKSEHCVHIWLPSLLFHAEASMAPLMQYPSPAPEVKGKFLKQQ